jgi:MFS family permease
MSWIDRNLAALGEAEFRKLFLGQAISVVGTMLTIVALPFAVLSIGGTATDIGLVEAANLVPMAIMLLVGGVRADRISRRLVMLAADFVRAAVQVTTAALLLSGVAEVWHLAALQVLMGASEAFFRPAYMGLVPQTVSKENLQQANALNGLVSSASITVGSIAGGLLVAGVGAGWAIGIDALTYLFSAWFLIRLRPQPAVQDEAAGESFIADLKAGWNEFRSHDWLWVMVLGASIFLFIVEAPLQVLGPVVAQDAYDGARTWGFAAAAMGVGQVIGGALALRWRPRRPLLIVAAGMSLTALPVAMLAFEAPLPFLLAGTAVLGVEWGLYDPFWMTVMQKHVAPEMLSRVVSYDYLGSLSMYPLGLAVAGPLAEWLGVETVLLISAAGAVVLSAFQVSMPGVRGLTRERPPSREPAASEVRPDEQ